MRPRLAASTYLNSAPLVFAFSSGSQRDRCELLPDPSPSSCASLLASGDVDAALIPSIELQRITGLDVASDVCIAARDAVQSVLLVSKLPIERVQSIALDEQSRTSAALVRILMRRHYGVEPSYEQSAPDLPAMLSGHDAALLIGDPAMTADTSGLDVVDLATAWNDFSGMPFTFALWAVRRGQLDGSGIDFRAARDEGLAAASEIAELYAPRIGWTRDDALEYLTSSIHYTLDAESVAGLDLFYRLAHEEGLCDRPAALEYWPG